MCLYHISFCTFLPGESTLEAKVEIYKGKHSWNPTPKAAEIIGHILEQSGISGDFKAFPSRKIRCSPHSPYVKIGEPEGYSINFKIRSRGNNDRFIFRVTIPEKKWDKNTLEKMREVAESLNSQF